MTDNHQLLRDCLNGKPAAQHTLYNQFAPAMLGVCYRYTKSVDDAEDVLQEAFVKVFKHLKQFEGKGELGGWIRRIMVTTAINYLKRNSRYQADLSFSDMTMHPVSSENPAVQADARDLANLIRQLPPGYQTIFNLHAVEGYTHVEIGKILGISEGTSRSQYSRARALLISWLDTQSATQKKVSMPENEFEKQVQQKMDQLRFEPSAAVWQKVEQQITAKKRRRFFIWFPLAAFLLGGAVWINYYTQPATGKNLKTALEKNTPAVLPDSQYRTVAAAAAVTKPTATAIAPVHQHNDAAGKKSFARPEAFTTAGKSKTNIAVATNGSATEKNNLMHPRQMAVAALESVNSRSDNKIARRNKNPLAPSNAAGERPNLQEAAAKTTAVPKAIPMNAGVGENDQEAVESSTNSSKAVSLTSPIIDSTTNVLSNAATAKDSLKTLYQEDGEEAITTTIVAGRLKRTIEWGATITGGISGSIKNFSLFAKSNSTVALSVNGTGNAGSGLSNSSPAQYNTASAIRPGIAWSAGVLASKPISRTLSISAGLQYSYLSNRINTGKMDTTGAGQFFNGRSVSFTNTFYFIELPVIIEKQLGIKSRFSINGGLAFAVLAGNTALLYDEPTNIYIADKARINQTQVNFLAGFNYRCWQTNSRLEIGPSFNYHLRNTAHSESPDNGHLFSAGINARIFFGKKKR